MFLESRFANSIAQLARDVVRLQRAIGQRVAAQRVADSYAQRMSRLEKVPNRCKNGCLQLPPFNELRARAGKLADIFHVCISVSPDASGDAAAARTHGEQADDSDEDESTGSDPWWRGTGARFVLEALRAQPANTALVVITRPLDLR